VTRPTVSVILPVRDGERFLEAAVRSILDQSYADFELLVVDDGSSDASARIADRFAREDRRVRVIQQSRLGQPAALNHGLELARGELIARMDADDVAWPRRLALQVGFLNEHPQVGIVGGATHEVTASGTRLRAIRYPISDAAIRRAQGRRYAFFCHPSVTFRANLVRRIGGYRAGFQPAEDHDLYLRLAEHSRMANLPHRILDYRLHPAQLSVTCIEQQVLGKWGGRCDAKARAGGRTEPFAGSPVTLERLRSNGCNTTTISNEIIGAVATRAALFATIGELEVSKRLIHQACDRARSVQLDAATRGRLAAALGCVLLGEGQRRQAAWALAGAAWADPMWAVGGAWRRLRLARSTVVTG
jgi:hypothetical protein